MAETAIARVFMTGRSQAVRLPKAFRLEGDRVRVRREGRRLVLEPIYQSGEAWMAALDEYGDEPFMPEGREQPDWPVRRDIDD